MELNSIFLLRIQVTYTALSFFHNSTVNWLAYMKIPTEFAGLGVDLNLGPGSNNFILSYVIY